MKTKVENIKWVIEMEVVNLKPGDVIVVHVDTLLTSAQTNMLYDQVERKFPNNEILILAGGMKMGIVRSDENQKV